MTVRRAIEILSEQENLSVDVVRPGVWQLTCGDTIDIIGEQKLVDLARQIEDDGA
jgi:hypothetical protein